MTSSRARKLGAGWLAGVGLLILVVVTYGFITSRSACDASGYQFACDIGTVFGLVGAVVGGLHLAAAYGIWRGRTWGVALGVVMALLGLLVCINVQDEDLWWLLLLATAGYLVTSLALVSPVLKTRHDRYRDTLEANGTNGTNATSERPRSGTR